MHLLYIIKIFNFITHPCINQTAFGSASVMAAITDALEPRKYSGSDDSGDISLNMSAL